MKLNEVRRLKRAILAGQSAKFEELERHKRTLLAKRKRRERLKKNGRMRSQDPRRPKFSMFLFKKTKPQQRAETFVRAMIAALSEAALTHRKILFMDRKDLNKMIPIFAVECGISLKSSLYRRKRGGCPAVNLVFGAKGPAIAMNSTGHLSGFREALVGHEYSATIRRVARAHFGVTR